MHRIQNLRKILKRAHLGGYIISNHIDQRYLTGFNSFNDGEALLAITAREVIIFLRGLYADELEAKFPAYKIYICKDLAGETLKLKIKNLGFDDANISYRLGKKFEKHCAAKPGLIDELRPVKDEAELKKITRACKISARACKYLKQNLHTGMTEKQAARSLEVFMLQNGADALAFDTIAAFGPNTANPHHVPTDRKLKKEDAVLFDYGCSVEGYASDITRSWWHGKRAPKEYNKIYSVVDAASQAILNNARPGLTGAQIDDFGRNIIKAAGYIDSFTHGIGHGLGLEIHEKPWVNPRGLVPVAQNTTFTVEPGIYLQGKYGVRLEETVVMTKNNIKILTKE